MADSFYRYWVNMEFMDSGGNKTRRRVEVDGGLAGVELAGNANTIITNMRAATDCNLTRYSIESEYTNDDQSYPTGDVNVEEMALLTLRLETAGKAADFTVPGPKAAIFVGTVGPNKNIVKDTAASTIIANIVDMFVAGSGAGRISDGEQTLASPNGFIKGKRIHRHSTRG